MDRTLSGAVALCAAVLCLLWLPAQAQIPQKINYQVMLTDDADQPLTDQSVQMVFELYAASSGGSPLWTETQNVTTNSIGVVSVILGAVNPINIDFDAPLWLEIQIDGEILSPRREIVTAPYAARAAMAENSLKLGDVEASEYVLLDDIDGPGTINSPGNPVDWDMLKNVPAGFADGTDAEGGSGDGHSLDADDGSPVDALYVDSDGNVGVGTASPEQQFHATSAAQVGSQGDSGFLRVDSGEAGGGGIYLIGDQDGGRLEISPPSRSQTVVLGPTGWPAGGARLWLARNDNGDSGFTVVGNNLDSQEPWMQMEGSSQTVTFDLSVSGDDAVGLPESTISSAETLDEPGVASIQAEPWVNLNTGSITSIAARTMTSVPADGYVFVMATAHLQMVNMPAKAHYAGFGVSELEGAWSDHAQEAYIQLPNGLPEGYYDQHVAVSGLFEVSGGSHTFYLNALEIEGEVAVRARQLTLMYLPTAYGTVDTID